MIYLNAYIFIVTVLCVMFCAWWLSARASNNTMLHKLGTEYQAWKDATVKLNEANRKLEELKKDNRFTFEDSRRRLNDVRAELEETDKAHRELIAVVNKRSELSYIKLFVKEGNMIITKHHRISEQVEHVHHDEQSDRHVITEWKTDGRREFTYLKTDQRGNIEKGYRSFANNKV